MHKLSKIAGHTTGAPGGGGIVNEMARIAPHVAGNSPPTTTETWSAIIDASQAMGTQNAGGDKRGPEIRDKPLHRPRGANMRHRQ